MEINDTDILIVGAGAAGLMAASGAMKIFGNEGGLVTILEKMPRPARKIMITGKGRCNYSNMKPWNEFADHIHPKADLLKPSFYNLTPESMAAYLAVNGVESVVERGDRAFPESHVASDVVDALVSGAVSAGAQLVCGVAVVDIVPVDGGFSVNCSDGSKYSCRKLVICTGGLSYPSTGSTGDGYRWASELGHKVSELFPSLTAIVPKGYKMIAEFPNGKNEQLRGHIDRSEALSDTGRLLCGNSLKNVSLTISNDGNIVQSEFGDIDFTDGGIEGPVGFKVSRKCVAALLHGAKVVAVIDMKPAVGLPALSARISALFDEISKDRRSSSKSYRDRFRILLGKVLPASLIPAFLRMNPGVNHKSLAGVLKCWKMDIAGYVGYERSVVTAGGVSREEIVPKTLESRKVSGLYFAGEVLDIDADTGGYNLQSAFSTGYLAGMSAARAVLANRLPGQD